MCKTSRTNCVSEHHIVLALQITPTPKYNNDGYEFLWLSGNIWSQLGMNITFSRWHGKNMASLMELFANWEVHEKHIIRSAAYKGAFEVSMLPGFRFDAFTTLGLFVVLGCLAQIRGLAGTSQIKVVTLLREIMSYSTWPNGLSFLPDAVLSVEEGETSFRDWLATLPRASKTAIKTRPFHCLSQSWFVAT